MITRLGERNSVEAVAVWKSRFIVNSKSCRGGFMSWRICKWVAVLSVIVPGLAELNAQDGTTNIPPKVAIFIPSSGTIFPAPANVVIAANAVDLDGTVSTVEFFQGTNSLGLTTNFPTLNPLGPFVLVWSNVPPGEYSLTGVATDNLGAKARSEPVRIAVREASNTLPIVTIVATDPEAVEGTNSLGAINSGRFTIYRTGGANQPLTVGLRIGGTASNGFDYAELASTAIIPAGTVGAEISVRPIDDNLIEDKESVILSLVSNATYRLGSQSSATVFIYDNDRATNQPPSVAIVTPTNGAMFIAPTTILLGANATDDGALASFEFFAGHPSLGSADGRFSTPLCTSVLQRANPPAPPRPRPTLVRSAGPRQSASASKLAANYPRCWCPEERIGNTWTTAAMKARHGAHSISTTANGNPDRPSWDSETGMRSPFSAPVQTTCVLLHTTFGTLLRSRTRLVFQI